MDYSELSKGDGPLASSRLHELCCSLVADLKQNKNLVSSDVVVSVVARGVTGGCARVVASVTCTLGASAAIATMRGCLAVALGTTKAKPSDAARVGAVAVLGSIFAQLGPEAGAMLQDAEKLCKLVKSSKTLRDVAVVALGNLLAGLGDSSRLMHEPIHKAFKSIFPPADKTTRVLLARSLGELGRAAGSAAVLEFVLESLAKLLEDTDSGVYAEAQEAMSKLLQHLAARRGAGDDAPAAPSAAMVNGLGIEMGGGGGGGGTAATPPPAAWNLVTAVKYACSAMKKTSPWARGGLGYAVTHLLFASKLFVKEERLGPLVSVMLGLLVGASASDDVAQLRAIASHVLRHGIGKTLGTAGRRKFLGILIKSVDSSLSNDWVRVVAFAEMAHLTQELGEEGGDLVDSSVELLGRFLVHSFQPLRHAVVSCLVTLAEASPLHTAPLCRSHLEQLAVLIAVPAGGGESPEARLSSAKTAAHAAALAALLAQGARSEFGIPQSLTDRAWQVAIAAIEGRTTAGNVAAGWAVLGSVLSFGASVVTISRAAHVFELLRATFVVNEKLSTDKAVVSYVRTHEQALSAILVLLESSQSVLTENNFFVLTQILNQVLTTVLGIGPPPPAAAQVLQGYKVLLYEVFVRLPSKFYQSASVALLKLLAGDIVDGPVSSLVRCDLSPADFVLESMAHASNADLFESPAPDLSIHALRNASLSKRLFFQRAMHIVVVDCAMVLFPLVFTTQQAKRQSQVLLHLVKCASVPGPTQQRLVLNSLCAISRVLQALTKLRTPLGAGPTLAAVQTWVIKHCIGEADALVRRSAARCIGLLCRSEGAQFTIGVLKTALAVLQGPPAAPAAGAAGAVQPAAAQPSFDSVAGASLVVGSLHKMTGAIQMASFQDAITQALLSRLSLGREMYPWILHALWLVVESRGPGFAPLATSTLGVVYNVMTGPVAHQSSLLCILVGRVANAIVSVLGLELQPGSKTFKRFSDIAAELRTHSHPLVQQEALAFKQNLILFAPRTVDVGTLILQLRRELRSSYVSLRTAAVVCTNQLLQMSAAAVMEQQLEQELFFMLDDATDPALNEQLERLISSLVDVLALAAPSRLVALCKEILEAKELRKPKQGIEAFAGPTGDEGKLKYADEEAEEDAGPPQNEEEEAAFRKEDQTFMPSILTKRYCLSSIVRVVQAVRGRPEHFDLKTARAERAKNAKADFLVFSLRELVNMASRAAASSVNSLRREGVLLMELLVNSFAQSLDPDFEGGQVEEEDMDEQQLQRSKTEVLLKQYEAPISSAITSSFTAAPPNVVAAACRVTATFLGCSVRYDPYTLNRLFELTGSLLESLLQLKQFDAYSWRASAIVQVAVLETYAKLSCNTGPNAPRILKYVAPLLPKLVGLWFLFLQDSVAVALPWVVDSSFPATFFPTQVPLAPELKQTFRTASPFVLEAASKHCDLSGNDNERNIMVGLCMRGASSSSPEEAASALSSLSNLFRSPATVEFMFSSGIFTELLQVCETQMKGSAPTRLACARLLRMLVDSIQVAQSSQDEKWARALDAAISMLASQVLSSLPALTAAQPLETALSQATADMVTECLEGFSCIHYSRARALQIGPQVLRIAIYCLGLANASMDKPCLVILRQLLRLPEAEGAPEEEQDAWESVLHAALVSLAQLPSLPTVLQVCVAVFSQLPFRHPSPSSYEPMAALFGSAMRPEADPASRAAAVSCFRLLLESSFRGREANAQFFAQCLLLLGAVGPDFMQLCCASSTHSEEELRILVLMHAIAGAQGHDVLTVLLPGFVALLDPQTGNAPHDAAMAVVLSLAQSNAGFKSAATQLSPARLAVLQASLKRKAEADAREREAEARKEKHARAAAGKIDFKSWGK